MRQRLRWASITTTLRAETLPFYLLKAISLLLSSLTTLASGWSTVTLYVSIDHAADALKLALTFHSQAFHASSGLALQIMERQQDILDKIGSLATTVNTCDQWKAWSERPIIDDEQNDSGI